MQRPQRPTTAATAMQRQCNGTATAATAPYYLMKFIYLN